MNQKEFFDVITVGTTFPPLVASALLARRGLRVLVVGSGRTELSGHNLIVNTLSSKLVSRILEELGVTYIVKRKMKRPESLYQVILPDLRIDVFRETEKFLEEMKREFPKNFRDIENLYNLMPQIMEGTEKILEGEHLIPPEGIIEKKKMEILLKSTPFRGQKENSEAIEKVLVNPSFSLFLKVSGGANSFLEPDYIDPFMSLFLHWRRFRNCAVWEGGMNTLEEIFYQRVDAYGGEVRLLDVPEEISLRGEKVISLRMEGKESLIGCDFLLMGLESEYFEPLMKDERKILEKCDLSSDKLVPTGLVATAQLLVSKEVIPEPMNSNIVVVFNEKAPLREDNFLWAEVDRLWNKENDKTAKVFLHYILDRKNLFNDPAYSKRVLDSIIKNLEMVMPFLNKFVIECKDPIENILRSNLIPNPLLRISRFLPSVYEYRGEENLPFLGLGYGTRIKNLFRVNSEVCPSIGEDGLWSSALGVANLLTSMRKSKTKLRRRIMFS